MKPEKSLIDEAIERLSADRDAPKVCDKCGGTGEIKGLFSSTWECAHCDGLGYTGDPVAIAKQFKEALIKRTGKIKQLGSHCSALSKENETLKSIYPDWKKRLNEHYEQQTHEKYRSRFD